MQFGWESDGRPASAGKRFSLIELPVTENRLPQEKTGLRPASPRKPFTLVELLVVIAIIAILASLLMPALKKAQSAAYTVTCQNNLKTLVSAVNTYADIYKDTYPWSWNENVWSWYCNQALPLPNILGYTDLSYSSYTAPHGSTVMNCPSSQHETRYQDYGTNSHLLAFRPGAGSPSVGAYKKRGALRSHSVAVVMGDLLDSRNNSGFVSRDGSYFPCSTYFSDCHMDGCNFSFADGHVERLEVFSLTNAMMDPYTFH